MRIVPEKPTDTKVLFPLATPKRPYDVPEVLEVHVVPSEEVMIVPESPTIMKVPFPLVTPKR